jgi:hypothetical protein
MGDKIDMQAIVDDNKNKALDPNEAISLSKVLSDATADLVDALDKRSGRNKLIELIKA